MPTNAMHKTFFYLNNPTVDSTKLCTHTSALLWFFVKTPSFHVVYSLALKNALSLDTPPKLIQNMQTIIKKQSKKPKIINNFLNALTAKKF